MVVRVEWGNIADVSGPMASAKFVFVATVLAAWAAVGACSPRDRALDGSIGVVSLAPETTFRVIAQGIEPSLTEEREAIDVYHDREMLQHRFPTLARRLPGDFDFGGQSVLVWVRPAPGPMGAGEPAVVGVSGGRAIEFTLNIDWRRQCQSWRGTAFALIELPGQVAPVAVSHRVTSQRGDRLVPYVDFSRDFSSLSRASFDFAQLRLLSTRDDAYQLLEELTTGPAARDSVRDLLAIDYERFLLTGTFAGTGTRPSITRIERDGNSAIVYRSDTRFLGPVPAIYGAQFHFVRIAEEDVEGVNEWRVLPDSSPEATRCRE